MKQTVHCAALAVRAGITLYHTGPALDHGPLPSIFYFSLSGPDSLCQDPYNQPVQFLAGKMIRVFSLTLPAHEEPLSPHDALGLWAEDFAKGTDCLQAFIDQVHIALDFAIQKQFVDPDRVAVAGLSKEFSHLQDNPLVLSYDAVSIAPLLADRSIRFYIGNRDTRVSTKACFDLTMAITEKAHQAHIRSPRVELIISPSVGQMGHGTPPEIFRQGAAWLEEHLSHKAPVK